MSVRILSIVIIAFYLCPASFAQAVTAEQVAEAIERGANFLKRGQKADGSWPERPYYGGGLTPLCTLALLHAGCDENDESVAKAMSFLRRYQADATYTTALQTMVFCAGGAKRDLPFVRRNVVWLESRQIRDGNKIGMWAIPETGTTDHTDNSMSHFALLALHEAERKGISAHSRTWQLALNHWQKNQNADGSWGWGPGHPGSGSMTCAGIAACIIGSGHIGAGDVRVVGDEVQCCGQPLANRPIEDALRWLEPRFSVKHNPGTNFWYSYYLYSLERAGRITARRFIGSHDWYREGAETVVKNQQISGAWSPDQDDERSDDPLISTSFSVMFLSKGRWPILIGQLQHAPADDWNHHRSALSHLVEHVERLWHRDLTYQIIDPEIATVEELLESPILYLSGKDASHFSAEAKRRLRMYLDRGGFLFAQRCCNGEGFETGFRALMKEIYPDPENALRLLPAIHPAWHAEQKVDSKYLKELWGIDSGCRTTVVYCPDDLSCLWELTRASRRQQYSPAVQEEIGAALSTGVNVLTYATNREVKFKDPGVLHPSPEHDKTQEFRGQLQLANVVLPGDCSLASNSLANLLQLAQQKLSLRVAAKAHDIKLTDSAMFDYHLLFMHGRTHFSLTPAERKHLKTYLQRGGMIFADAICSSKEFADSFRAEMAELFPEAPLTRIPSKDPLFSTTYGGEDLAKVLRREAESDSQEPIRSKSYSTEPNLEAIKLGDRYAVVFSPLDISCALQSHSPVNCDGYVREDAARISINVLCYSFHR